MNRIIIVLVLAVAFIAGCKCAQKTGGSTNASTSENGRSVNPPSRPTDANRSDNTVLGALLDAAVGGSAGVIISQKMDKQAKEMEADLGKTALVERVGEGIKLTFNTQLLFDVGQSYLKESNRADLRKFAGTLKKYPETDMLIVGHTDDIGSDAANQALSEKRANAVANHLIDSGVDTKRMLIQGWGETQPSVLNNSEENRSQNRRVEIAVYANAQMKTDAKKQAGE